MEPIRDYMTIDTNAVEMLVQLLREQHFPAGDCVENAICWTLEGSAHDFVAAVREVCHTSQWVEFDGIHVLHPGAGELIARVRCEDNNENDRVVRAARWVTVIGRPAAVAAATRALHARFDDLNLPSVQWWFTTQRGTVQRDVVLNPGPPLKDAFYPWLADGVDDFVDRYVKSSASLLFLYGPPGTGKTSLLRHLLQRHRLSAIVTYEDKLMQKDEMFVHFLTMHQADVLVVEDADDMLKARDSAGNQMISRFLNISDGLIKFARKKVVFTTNLANFAGVDPALLREGRCFDVVECRQLRPDEAARAAAAAGIADPGRAVTLAELFNERIGKAPGQPVGFAAR